MRSKIALFTRTAALVAVVASSAANAQTVEEIIAKNLEARGGRDKILATQQVRVTGKMTMGPTEAPFVMEWRNPNRVRLEFTVGGQTGVQAYDGTTGWMHMPFMGKAEPEEMAPEMVADMQQQADFAGPLVDYAAKGHQVALVGKREVEGTEVYDLQITLENGDVVHELIDAESFLTIKQESRRKQGDQEIDLETSLGNYREVGGLLLPHSLETKMKGAPAGAPGQSITIESYDFAATIDEARFAFPKPAPKAN
jgi:hypothetical protein